MKSTAVFRRSGITRFSLAAALVAVLVLVPGVASADHCTDAALEALLIGDTDLPRGYVRDPEATGRVDVEAAVAETATADARRTVARELHCGYRRTWVNDRAGSAVTAVVFELRSDAASAQFLREAQEAASRLDPVGFPVDITDGRGHIVALEDVETGEEIGERAMVSFRRGPFAFTVVVDAAVADTDLASTLATELERRAPSGDTAPAEPFDVYNFLGRMAGAILVFVSLYLIVLGAAARSRDRSRLPASVRSKQPFPGSAAAPGQTLVDVSPRARRARITAMLRFGAQILGLSLLLPGIVPAFWPTSLPLVATGLFLVGALPWWLRRRERGRTGTDDREAPHLFTGRRTGRVTLLLTAALVLLLAAAMLTGLSAVTGARGEAILVPQESGDDIEIDPTLVAAPGILVAIALAAGGVALYRRGRRLAALDAKAVMERDDRPIVLYLRSFTDDDVRIRTAVTGRRSLIEQLSPSRFDRFEEILAWELNRIGPVVALNPPATSLPPVGAARTTLSNEAWQPTIAQWMDEAALIVVNAPPGERTEGLLWELQKIQNGDLWFKTVFVCPPVAGGELGRRWTVFRGLLDELGVGMVEPPVDPATVLAASFSPPAEWSFVVADERTEWTYVAAIRELAAAGRSPSDAPVRGHS